MRRIIGLGMAALLVLTISACGSDDDTGSGDTTVPAASDDGGTTTDGGDDDGSTDDGSTDDGSTDGAAALGLVDEDCQFLLASAFLSPLAGLASGAESDAYEENAERLEELAGQAPEEVQDAMATVSAAWAEMTEALEDVDLSDVESLTDPDVQAAFEELGEGFDEEYEQASQTVSDYASENCSG
jgi:hypothetical protein